MKHCDDVNRDRRFTNGSFMSRLVMIDIYERNRPMIAAPTLLTMHEAQGLSLPAVAGVWGCEWLEISLLRGLADGGIGSLASILGRSLSRLKNSLAA